MATAFPLPLECLQLVIRHLADDRDSCSLATLLRVNTYVRSATLPIMYEDPFTLPILSCNSSPTKTLAPIFKLMKVLLLSLPDNTLVTDLMRAAYLSDTTEEQQDQQSSTKTTSTPYYSFNIIIDFDQFSPPYCGIFYKESFAVCADFTDYLQWSGQASRYLAEEVAARLKHARACDIITCASNRELRRDFTWALCANAENIQSLVLPISDIDRYLVIVARFKVLSSVVFILDRDIQITPGSEQQLTPEEEEILTLQHSDRIRHLEGMISFVQEHRRLYPGVLVLGRCAKGEYTIDVCPAEYQLRLYQALPPLGKPLFIDTSNWYQFVANVGDTDLSRTRLIHPQLDLEKDGDSMDRLLKAGPFLHRCRALESINLGYLGDDAFQWAVDERRQFDTDLAAGWTSQRPLVPLRHFLVDGLPSANGRQIDNVGYAFRDTLETISIRSFSPWSPTQVELPDLLIGANNPSWILTRLSALQISAFDADLCIHPGFLERCPHLSFLSLTDRRQEYSLGDVTYWRPAVLPLLSSLMLKGTPALSFHPDTFRNTPGLVHVMLEVIEIGWRAFIPPAEEFEENEQGDADDGGADNSNSSIPLPRRPVWTWDWELPKLTTLILNGEFAYRFKFRMLHGTPSLTVLSINSKSLSLQHKRHVSLADLIKPGFQHPAMERILVRDQERHRQYDQQQLQNPFGPSNGSSLPINPEDDLNNDLVWREFEFVQASALKDFILFGDWHMESRVLDVLFGKVVPHLENVAMSQCLRHDFADWITSTSRNLPRLATAVVKMYVNERNIASAGLEAVADEGGNIKYYKLVEPPVGRTVTTIYRFW